jgi:uncharacterized membrane protein YebE (DUF533 family)
VRRLTISVRACTETLALLVAMAWADGNLDDDEREGIRDAAKTLNLPKELRDRLERYMEEAPPLDELELGAMSKREQEFAFVASAWLANLSEGIVDEEQELLDEIAAEVELDEARQDELTSLATELDPPAAGESWAKAIQQLFSAIAAKV